MITFHNPGEADINALTILGANVKESSSTIGQFGTGFKYAVAVLLREGYSLELFSGIRRYYFSLAEKTIRGKKFSIIQCNGESLAFTTEYGKNWTVAMALRELQSNALDENGNSYIGCRPPSEDETVIHIFGMSEETYTSAMDEFFKLGEQYYSNHKGGFHKKEIEGVTRIFNKKVKVGEIESDLPFDVSLNYVTITEDRTLFGSPHGAILRLIVSCNDPIVLKQLFSCKSKWGSWFDFSSIPAPTYSREFIEQLANHSDLPPYDIFYPTLPGPYEPTPLEARMLRKAIQAVGKIWPHVPPVDTFRCGGPDTSTLGIYNADTKRIGIFEKAFKERRVLETLIHEMVHAQGIFNHHYDFMVELQQRFASYVEMVEDFLNSDTPNSA